MRAPADIVAAARKYLGRPIRHQGRTDAFDCVGLVLAVAEDLALLDRDGEPILRAQYANYPSQPVNGFVDDECRRRLILCWPDFVEPSLTPPLEAGDVLTLRLPSVPCHAGIVSELAGEPGIIHAYSPVGRVVEHRLDDRWIHRIAGVFRFPGLRHG